MVREALTGVHSGKVVGAAVETEDVVAHILGRPPTAHDR
jgi:hypothetical protein